MTMWADKLQTIASLARRHGLPSRIIGQRLKRGWSLKKAIETQPISGPRDIKGDVFGYLTVVKILQRKNKDGVHLWECMCICGNRKIASAKMLLMKKVKSCGCLTHAMRTDTFKRYEYKGEMYNLQELSRKTRIAPTTLRDRLKKMSVTKAIVFKR